MNDVYQDLFHIHDRGSAVPAPVHLAITYSTITQLLWMTFKARAYERLGKLLSDSVLNRANLIRPDPSWSSLPRRSIKAKLIVLSEGTLPLLQERRQVAHNNDWPDSD